MKQHMLLGIKPHYNTSLSFSILPIDSEAVCPANMLMADFRLSTER
jgi:hypothetical protein